MNILFIDSYTAGVETENSATQTGLKVDYNAYYLSLNSPFKTLFHTCSVCLMIDWI